MNVISFDEFKLESLDFEILSWLKIWRPRSRQVKHSMLIQRYIFLQVRDFIQPSLSLVLLPEFAGENQQNDSQYPSR